MWKLILITTAAFQFGNLAAGILTVPFPVPASGQFEIARNPDALRACWRLVANARFGFSRIEQAAFIVRDGSGQISAVDWAASGEPDSARWVGPFPLGTVAIVHTHPNWMPAPSAVDIHTARCAHVPVYVLTRSRICKTEGGPPEIVVDGDWRPQS